MNFIWIGFRLNSKLHFLRYLNLVSYQNTLDKQNFPSKSVIHLKIH